MVYLVYLSEGLCWCGMVEMFMIVDGIIFDMIVYGSVFGVMMMFIFGIGVFVVVVLCCEGEVLMCSELWGGWFDYWGEWYYVWFVDSMGGIVCELFDEGGLVSLYMVYGGMNFGLWNGVNYDEVL